ncbi:hypothetical protein MPSEU_000679200 [Mayamaea pseudoterrestris]|nr:hypothetical protein MPSEU_000679200 [Mayamaea pseudoterrestris]
MTNRAEEDLESTMALHQGIMRPTAVEAAAESSSPRRIYVRIQRSDTTNDDFDNLQVTVSDLMNRERDMQSVANAYEVSHERWKTSRLFDEYRLVVHELGSDDDNVAVTLDPISFYKEHHLCEPFTWTHELTRLISDFYETGLLQVTEEIHALQLLLALEYFGILYRPEQLVFASVQAYESIKEWSDYLAQRSFMADWIAEQIILTAAGDNMNYYFATSNQNSDLPVINHEHLHSSDPDIVWAFFNAPNTGLEMQRDFCHFLEHSSTTVQAKFISTQGCATAAILRVRLVGPQATLEVSSMHVEEDSYAGYAKTDTELEYQECSSIPRHVAHFDDDRHQIYKDVSVERKANNEIAAADDDGLDRYSMQKQHLLMKETQLKKKGFVNRPWRRDVEKPSFAVRPPRNSQARSVYPAPVAVIRAQSSELTVQSGLMGPCFVKGSELRDGYVNNNQVRAEALRQEWIQSSVLNRGLSTRIRALLDESSHQDQRIIGESYEGLTNINKDIVIDDGDDDDYDDDDDDDHDDDSTNSSSGPKRLNGLGWDWIANICEYPDRLIKNDGQPCSSNIALDKILDSVEKVFDSTGRAACANAPKVAEPVKQQSRTGTRKAAIEQEQSPQFATFISNKLADGSASPSRRGMEVSVSKHIKDCARRKVNVDPTFNEGEPKYVPRRTRVSLISGGQRPVTNAVGKLNHSYSTLNTVITSRSASRPMDVTVKEKSTSKLFAAIRAIFRKKEKKKQYRV